MVEPAKPQGVFRGGLCEHVLLMAEKDFGEGPGNTIGRGADDVGGIGDDVGATPEPDARRDADADRDASTAADDRLRREQHAEPEPPDDAEPWAKTSSGDADSIT